MGVTNRNEVRYKNPETASSTESLHIPLTGSQTSLASTVDLAPVHITLRRRRTKIQNDFTLTFDSLRNAGRRRQRRYGAVTELQALIEEEEIESFLENGIPHKSFFSEIIQNPELEKIWDQFVEKDEAEQEKLLNMSDKSITRKKPILTAYDKISYNIRLCFKLMRDLSELLRTESEIIDFFKSTPDDIYINDAKTSYQRLLIHGISQYYGLLSLSYTGMDGKRTIKVVNSKKRSDFYEKTLATIVQDNHNNIF